MANEFASIPEPTADSQSLLASVSALKQTVEALIGQRGTDASTAVTQADLTAQSNLAGVTPAVALANLGLPTTGSAAFFQVANNLSEGTAATMRTSLGLVIPTNVRERLAAARTYFVRTDGSDSNTGLVDSAGGAFLTLQAAYNLIVANLDLAGQTVTIQIKDGTYTGRLLVSQPWTGGGAVTIQGNSGTPSNVVISTTSLDCVLITANLPGILTIKNLRVQTATSGDCLKMRSAGTLQFGNIDFGACAGNHMNAQGGGAFIQAVSNYSVSGSAVVHMLALGTGSQVEVVGLTVTLTGTPAFSFFVFATTLGYVDGFANTYSGAATGTRYHAESNAVIFTSGAGATYFPGNAGGTVATGGVYL